MKNLELAEKQIKKFSIFEGIEESELGTMLDCIGGYTRSFSKNEYIIMETDSVHQVGLVLEGNIHMIKEDYWGNRSLITYMGKGEVFGESFSLRKDNISSVSFLASQPSEVLFLPLSKILYTCSKSCPFHQRLIINMQSIMSEKNIQLMEKIDILSKDSLREKIMAYLYVLSTRQQSRTVKNPLNRTQMANYLNVNRSAMARELSSMKKDGLIDFDQGMFILKK